MRHNNDDVLAYDIHMRQLMHASQDTFMVGPTKRQPPRHKIRTPPEHVTDDEPRSRFDFEKSLRQYPPTGGGESGLHAI